MTTPNDAARPVAQLRGTPFGPGVSIPLNGAHIHLEDGECMDLYTATDYDTLRAEVEGLRDQLREAREDRDTQEGTATQAFAAHARERARAEAALAQVARVIALCDEYEMPRYSAQARDFADKFRATLNAKGDEGNG